MHPLHSVLNSLSNIQLFVYYGCVPALKKMDEWMAVLSISSKSKTSKIKHVKYNLVAG